MARNTPSTLIELLDMLQRAESDAAAFRHKAEQYNDVAAAVQAADGGRYRNDTVDSLLHRLSALAALRSALEPFARFCEAYRGRQDSNSDDTVVAFNGVALTLGDLRRAREALKEPPCTSQ